MMKKSLISFLFLFLGLGLLSLSAETRIVNIRQPFSELDASAGVKIVYQPGSRNNPTVKISGDSKRIANVDVRISGKTLKISPKRDQRGNRNGSQIKGVIVTVNAPMVNNIDVSSGASVRCDVPISIASRKMEFDASSGASISFAAVDCSKIELDASSGAGISIKKLKANKAELDVSSGAGISVNNVSTASIECDASSGGSIKLAGISTKGSFSASSGGSIKASGLSVRNSKVDKSIGGSIRVNSQD